MRAFKPGIHLLVKRARVPLVPVGDRRRLPRLADLCGIPHTRPAVLPGRPRLASRSSSASRSTPPAWPTCRATKRLQEAIHRIHDVQIQAKSCGSHGTRRDALYRQSAFDFANPFPFSRCDAARRGGDHAFGHSTLFLHLSLDGVAAQRYILSNT